MSLEVQWLRLHAPNARGPGLIPGQGTRSHMTMKSSYAPTKEPAYRNKDQRFHMLQQRLDAAK